MLEVFIDFKSPESFLAIAPSLALAEKLDLALSWHPFRTRQQPVPEEKAHETVGESHRRVRAAARRATHLHYAKLRGIDLRFSDPPGDTDLALGVLAQLNGDPTVYVQAAFAAYWDHRRNLDDPETVRALLQDCGIADEGLVAGAPAALADAQQAAEDRGIVDTPAYLIADQLFIGREHLPWIEEIATTG